ncbi:MAG: AMP-binding protein, partial [Beijerinckiaceae bacterium]|nr:AMP-binding protein [Beijerinckiaceae bacterium]
MSTANNELPAGNSLPANSGGTVCADMVALLCARAAGDSADRPAFVFLGDGENETARLTFGELDRAAKTIAVHLLQKVEPGERALLLYPSGLDFIVAFLGCLYAGVVAVPVNPPSRHHLERLRCVAQDATPALVITTEELRKQLEPQAMEAWGQGGVHWQATDGLDLAAAKHWTSPGINPGSLAFLQYTSGSTGAPKGVMISHGNLMSNEASIQAAFGHDCSSTVVGWLPAYHDMGLIGNILQPLFAGAAAYLMPPLAFLEKPLRWLKAISKYQAHTSGGPNFAYELCLRSLAQAEKQGLDLSSWTLAFNGSETVRAATLHRFAAAFAVCGFRKEAFFPCYGLAEATLLVSAPDRGRAPALRGFDKFALSQGLAAAEHGLLDDNDAAAGCGHGWSDHELRIVDPETLTVCPDGRIGEIWVAGPSVAQGYWGKPKETAETFGASTGEGDGPYLRTGDLGFMHDGALFIAGRIKDLIIIRGANYYASDFERILDQDIPGLRPGCNAAFGVTIEGEETLVLAAEVRRDHLRKNGAESIYLSIRKAMAYQSGLAPGEIVLVPPGAIPKTTSGKIRRRACRKAYLDGTLPVLARSGRAESFACGCAPKPEELADAAGKGKSPDSARKEGIEDFLRRQLARLLSCARSQIPGELSLLELGIDSLKLVELKHRADARFGIDLPLSILLSDISVRTLAEKIAALPSANVSPAPGETTGLSYTQQAIWAVHGLDDASISYNLHLVLNIAGILDVERLRAALAEVMDRHAQLRTVYRQDNGPVIQQALPRETLPAWFETVDANGWSAPALQADMGRRARQPFQLDRGPPLRITAYRHGKDHTALLICAHHIAVDAWSLFIILKETGEAYSRRQSRKKPEQTPPRSYAEFVSWQKQYLESTAGKSGFEYWRAELDRALPLLALPTDFPRVSAMDYHGASEVMRLGPELTLALKTLAAGQRVSLFALLLAAYQLLLHRYAGQNEIVVGVPSSGRTNAGFAGLAGNCVNPLAIIGHPEPDKTFPVFLREIGEKLRHALARQDFPFPLLAERLKPERHGDQWPVFQTSFVLQQPQTGLPPQLAVAALGEDSEPFSWCGCTGSALALRERVETFDLKL